MQYTTLNFQRSYVGIALAVNYCKCGARKTYSLNEEEGEKAPLIVRYKTIEFSAKSPLGARR